MKKAFFLNFGGVFLQGSFLYAGRVYLSNFTEANRTVDFVTDDMVPDVPLPHDRVQICHFGIRLCYPSPQNWASTFRRAKMTVAYGFETEFYFRVLHRSQECMTAGQKSNWCYEQGGDGFAFVIQNQKRNALGLDRAGLAYSGMYDALAIEFDMYRDWDKVGFFSSFFQLRKFSHSIQSSLLTWCLFRDQSITIQTFRFILGSKVVFEISRRYNYKGVFVCRIILKIFDRVREGFFCRCSRVVVEVSIF